MCLCWLQEFNFRGETPRMRRSRSAKQARTHVEINHVRKRNMIKMGCCKSTKRHEKNPRARQTEAPKNLDPEGFCHCLGSKK